VDLYLSFVVTSSVLILIPGPNVLVIVSTSIAHGSRRGLQTVLGTTAAMAIQLAVVAAASVWFVHWVAAGLVILQWLGIVYLFYLAARHFYLGISGSPRSEPGANGSFGRGFLVSLANAKTLFFFSAFLPQFVSPGQAYAWQIGSLSLSFLVLALVGDGLYAVFAGKLSRLLAARRWHGVQHSISGTVFLGAGTWLWLLRKPV